MDIFILGAGGHAKVLLDALRADKKVNIKGILDINPNLKGQKLLDIPILGSEEEILANCSPAQVKLVNGIGTTQLNSLREKLFMKFKQLGYQFYNVIHPTAIIGSDVTLGEGVQVMAGAVIQTGTQVGDNVIINTSSSVDHDSRIEPHTHIAPGVTCCGGVTVGTGSHIGSGAVILQNIQIGPRCLVAAGAVVVRNMNSDTRVAGVPAKCME